MKHPFQNPWLLFGEVILGEFLLGGTTVLNFCNCDYGQSGLTVSGVSDISGSIISYVILLSTDRAG